VIRKGIAAVIAALGLVLPGLNAVALGSHMAVDFASQTVSGVGGVSYVYFQARDAQSGAATTVPTHRFTGCPTPYYMRWTNVVVHPNSTSYDVQIYDCRTGQPVNDGISRAGQWFWGPGSQFLPAGMSQVATGLLVYALNVSLTPPVVQPNQETTLSAAIADDFIAQADRTLNISVDPGSWSVTSWSIDFGDGQKGGLPRGTTAISAPHRYTTPADVNPVVTAHVRGFAQVADFDPSSGSLVLVNEPFAVDVTNRAVGQVTEQPVVAYTPPQVRAGVLSRLQPGSPALALQGLDAIEAPRGTPVYIYVRPIVDAEGTMTLDGRPAGTGKTVLLSWRLRSGGGDGPPSQVTAVGMSGPPQAAVVLQWNAPDRIGSGGAQPFAVGLDLTVRTTYPDGQTRDYGSSGAVSVTVVYAANSG
jgi:hypothetical protein